MYNPSNPVESFRVSNLHIVDDGGIFSSNVGGLLGTQIDTNDYTVLSNNIKLFLYTSINERINWKTSNLSSNEIAVFVFKNGNKLLFRIKLSENLLSLSRFKSKDDMLKCEIEKDENTLSSKKLSIAFLLSFFDTLDESLFNIVAEKEIREVLKKQINISKRGDIKPIELNPIKGKLNITIGLFFDGTGNNKFNTARVHDFFSNLAENDRQGKSFTEIVDDYRSGKMPILSKKSLGFAEYMLEPKSSYLNSYSNISKLFNLYDGIDAEEIAKENFDHKKEIVLKIYIEGIGTKQGEDDSLLGSAFGRGGHVVESYLNGIQPYQVVSKPYGVESRCEEAIQKVSECLLELQNKFEKDNKEIGEVIFDVFGFSRGAAAARLFYRRLFMDAFLIDVNLKNKVKIESYKIRFYGLYDTVLSLSDSSNEDISLKLCSCPCYHIIAQDEIRENFPLVHVDAENCVDLELFGAHSDIGGGYTRDEFIASFAFKESEKDEPIYDIKKIFNAYKRLYAVDTNKKYLQYFVDQVSLKYKQARIVTESEPANQQNKEMNVNYLSKTKFGYLAKDHRLIENDISKVSLQAMLLFAAQHKLPFKEYKLDFSSKLHDEDKKTLSAYKVLAEKIIKNLDKSSERLDNLNDKDFFNLYHRFIHISESYEYQIFSKYYDSKIHETNLLYANRPTKDRVRVKYLMQK